MTNRTNLIILGQLNFPYGSASSARIYNYSKGIVENEGKVTIICIKALIKNKLNNDQFKPKGIIEGIHYIYSPGTQYRSGNFIIRRFLEIKGIIKATILLLKYNKKEKISSILFFSTSPFNEIYFIFFSIILKIPVIRELNEYPFLRNINIVDKIENYISKKIMRYFYDGVRVMTKYLETYYRTLLKKSTKSILITILIDEDRYKSYYEKDLTIKDNYIAYCGDPSGNKDGVRILIEAFSIISKKFEDIKLYIIGDGWGNIIDQLKEFTKALKIQEKVVFTGNVSVQMVHKYLFNAKILALARPTSLQSAAGFPTKLGEYLITGRPVIVTKVGEIPEYLIDNESAFLVNPDSTIDFANKLDFILLNKELAELVGSEGRLVARQNFNYKIYARRLLTFINDLKK